MAEPINPSFSPDRLAEKLKTEISHFSSLIKEMIESPLLAQNSRHLDKMQKVLFELEKITSYIQDITKDEDAISLLHDGADTIQNILTQSLDIKDAKGDISLLAAARNPHSEEFKLVMQSFIDYPGPTDALLTELQLLMEDLT